MQRLAILGRGIRQKEDGSWVPTRDLEMYGPNFAPKAKLEPVDENSENCLSGGGELNVLAGGALVRLYPERPEMVVCAYGGRSRYLTDIPGAPNEAEVMTYYLAPYCPFVCSQIRVWPHDEQAPSGKTNTFQELENIFKLAVECGYTDVAIVTIFVHYARTLLMGSHHLRSKPFAHLKLECFVSEDILMRYGNNMETRIKYLHGSRAFTRTLFYEQRGVNALLAGKY